MSTTLQAIVVVAAVAAISVVAVDSFDLWKTDQMMPYAADKSNPTVYAANPMHDYKTGTISVTGTASASVEPDLFTVRLGVQTQNESAEIALASNSEMMDAVIGAVMDAGITRDEISTTSLNVNPVFGDYDRETRSSPLIGFEAVNIVLIKTSKLDLAAPIIDGAAKAGANRIDGISFTLSPDMLSSTKDSLLQTAVLDAKARANLALEPLGKSVGDALAVNLSPDQSVGYAERSYALSDTAFSPSNVFSSSQNVKASVHVVFAIQ